jgi:protein TonB
MVRSIIFSFFLAFIAFSSLAQDILTSAEQMPEPVGGLKTFYEYINANLQYPAEAKSKKVEGRVHVTFVVEPDGSLSNIQVTKGLGSGCDEEAIRLIKNCPKWTPGKQGGTPVRVQVTRPITFKL